jgi:hypothetical protein
MKHLILRTHRRNPLVGRDHSNRRLRLHGPRYIKGRRTKRLTAVWTWRARNLVPWGLQ